MTAKNKDNSALELSAAEIAKHQEMAKEALLQAQKDTNVSDTAKIYPFGGSFSITGIGYILLMSVTPMEFTNGIKLSYKGEGGGAAIGSGVFLGGGVFNVDPTTLPREGVHFAVAATPGVGGLSITWIYNGRIIGTFRGIGPSAFVGGGGGYGHFTRL